MTDVLVASLTSKAAREIEDTEILVSYLLAHHLDFDDPANFTDRAVKVARAWKRGTR